MAAAVAGADRQRAPRWMVVALFSSLVVNLIVIGATGGFLWRHRFELAAGVGVGAHLAPNLLGYASTLPEVRRKELWGRTEDGRNSIRPFRRAVREARSEALRALTAEPFDRQGYLAAQAQLLAADYKAREAVYRLYSEIAVNLTPEERRGFVHWREKRRPLRNLLDEPDKQASDAR